MVAGAAAGAACASAVLGAMHQQQLRAPAAVAKWAHGLGLVHDYWVP